MTAVSLNVLILVPVKEEAGSDGQFVYYGADTFGVLENQGGWLVNEGIVHAPRGIFIHPF